MDGVMIINFVNLAIRFRRKTKTFCFMAWILDTLLHDQVLDLSFNDFKGPGFEPLQNCQVLQVSIQSCNLHSSTYICLILS